MKTMAGRWRLIAMVVLLPACAALWGWNELYRLAPQPSWITNNARARYFYASISSEQTTGIPYWVWLVMPRVFPEYMPGVGGYSAFGLSWEQGVEMPVGFAKQRKGYVRVSGNCALCHAISEKAQADEVPTILPVSAGRTTHIEPLLAFYRKCAQDPRFNADELLSEIDNATQLPLGARVLYRYLLIPRIRKALLLDPAQALFDAEIRAHGRDGSLEGLSQLPPLPAH